MKLDCGLTSAEKKQEHEKYITNWHRHFTWWPIRVGYRDCRWLEYVERKLTSHKVQAFSGLTGGFYWDIKKKWEYRSISG